MSGYLSHLIARTSGTEPALQPARGNPFESPPLGEEVQVVQSVEERIAGLGRHESAVARTTSAASTSDATASRADSGQPAAAIAQRMGEILEQTVTPRVGKAGGATVPDLVTTDDVTPVASVTVTASRAGREAAPPEDDAMSAAPGRTVRRSAAEGAADSEPALDMPGAPTPQRRPVQSIVQQEVVAAARRDARVAPAAKADGRPVQVRPLTHTVPLVRALPPTAPAQGIPAGNSGPSSPPDVHITIGRVEIRAHQPPAAVRGTPRPVRALRPSMSLADYLQRRRGERP